jgi:hypothetical protein
MYVKQKGKRKKKQIVRSLSGIYVIRIRNKLPNASQLQSSSKVEEGQRRGGKVSGAGRRRAAMEWSPDQIFFFFAGAGAKFFLHTAGYIRGVNGR